MANTANNNVCFHQFDHLDSVLGVVPGRVLGELGVEGRRTLVEESGFILLLISPGNREHQVSRSGSSCARGRIRVHKKRTEARIEVPLLLTATSCSLELEANADVEKS